ncbi:hypothetical protein AC1031_012457 [Aphanomyces cochlioides]|nr:hypothetical protein AC1031_012457 [Aphanomyces cochlioides]
MTHSRSSVSAWNLAKSTGRSSAYRSSKHAKKRSKAAGIIFANLGTFNSLLILSVMSIVLVFEGVFTFHGIDYDAASDATSMNPHGSTCRVDASGFIPATCQPHDIATTTTPAWMTIGETLALQWQAGASPFLVTTCTKTKSNDSGQVALVFLAGYDSFPQCQPTLNGPQEIAGMAMLETTVRDEFQDGAYMLTERLIATVTQTLIATNGSVTIDAVGINSVQYSVPLGRRYKVSSWTSPVVVDLTAEMDPTSFPRGWNVSRISKKAIAMTWMYRHQVDHWQELLILHFTVGAISWALFSGDFYLTIQGLRGFLQHKPVMSYPISTSLERRRLILLLWAVLQIVAWVYADALRCFQGGASLGLWLIVAASLAGFHMSCLMLTITCVQRIPSPFQHVATFSPDAMQNMVFPLCPIVWLSRSSAITRAFHAAPIALGLNISGVVRSSGAYANGDLINPDIQDMTPISLSIVIGSFLTTFAMCQIQRKRQRGAFLLNVAWTKTNGFLDACQMPHWITGLPLDEHNMIKIGNKLYCKPSLQATLGFASVVPRRHLLQSDNNRAAEKPSNDEMEMTLVSIYATAPTLSSMHRWLPRLLSPSVFGTIKKNSFTRPLGHTLDDDQYVHDRGVCAN